MADTLFLSRLSLRRDAALAALAPVLAPDDDDSRVDLGHKLCVLCGPSFRTAPTGAGIFSGARKSWAAISRSPSVGRLGIIPSSPLKPKRSSLD